ncbi:MAG: radical SAM protein, partial [Myxococcota bacterium]
MTEAIHDFSAKLRQPSLREPVANYIRWRRALARARAAGSPEPPPPEQAPVSINLDLTTACNYRCDHCIDWEILNSREQHDDARLRASIETLRARGLRSVILIGGGEPTLYPDFASFVGFLKAQGLQTAIVSNGSRGDRLLEAAEHLEEGDWLRLSLD